jgi:lipopolysaccharide heptosyltransferase II
VIDRRTVKLNPRRIAVFRALQLGDLLQAIPALRAIRTAFPNAEITLIGLPWAKSFIQRFLHYIDRFVEFAGFPGIAEIEVIPERTTCFIEEQRAYGYDLAIQMHGSGPASNDLVFALGAKVTAGYYEGERPDELVLGAPYPDEQPEVYRNLGLAKLLGCLDCHPRLEFPLCNEDRTEAATLLRRLPRADRPWIALHPGARPPSRRWPAHYFASVADTFARRFNAQIMLTGSPDEKEIVQAVEAQMATRPINLAGKTSLGGLAALISELNLFVSNDTGPAHIADAVGTPSITIFGPADHRRWAPLDQTHHPIVRRPVVCSPCGYWDCPVDHRCLRWVRPEMIITVAERLLLGGTVSCNV